VRQIMHTDETGGSHVQSASSGLGDGPGSALDEGEEEEGEEEEGPGPRGDAAQGEGETGNAHWPNRLVADIALAISKALSPTTVADRAPFLRFLPLMDHDAILNLRTEYKKLVQSGWKGVNVAKHIRRKLGKDPFGDACYLTALGRWQSEVFWITAFCDDSETGYTHEEFFIGPLFDRDASEIKAITQTFKSKRYMNSLERFIRNRVKLAIYREAALLALEGIQDSASPDMVAKDIEDINAALDDRFELARKVMPIILARNRSHLLSVWQGYKDRYGSDFVPDLWPYTGDDAVRNSLNELPRLIVIVITEPYFDIRNLWRSKPSDARRHIVVSCVGETPLQFGHLLPRPLPLDAPALCKYQGRVSRKVRHVGGRDDTGKVPTDRGRPQSGRLEGLLPRVGDERRQEQPIQPPNILHFGNLPPDASLDHLRNSAISF
jgi:hypothetical protein